MCITRNNIKKLKIENNFKYTRLCTYKLHKTHILCGNKHLNRVDMAASTHACIQLTYRSTLVRAQIIKMLYSRRREGNYKMCRRRIQQQEKKEVQEKNGSRFPSVFICIAVARAQMK